MLAAGIFDLFPSTILAIDGAVCGFGLLYVIPICLHLKACAQDRADVSSVFTPLMDSQHRDSEKQSVGKDRSSLKVVDLAADYRAQPLRLTQVLYGALFIFGIVLLVLQLYQTVVDIISDFQS